LSQLLPEQTPRPCSAAIGLGGHDLGVAALAADLYLARLFPVLVFSGGNSPTTTARFPRGEAVHYAEHATALGVPPGTIVIEPRTTNTGQNIDYSRDALAAAGIPVTSVMLISKPYMQRRACATIRNAWPEAEPPFTCGAALNWEDGPVAIQVGIS
jgi:uncharacterized SAM-binding protein YcdF (DUF218 family)